MLEEKQKTLESNLEELQKEKHILEALCVDYTLSVSYTHLDVYKRQVWIFFDTAGIT